MWLYEGEAFTQDNVEEHYGFVYMIVNNLTGKKYIGKKVFYSKITRPPLKGKKRKRRCIKTSNWEKYWGSSKYLTEDITKFGKQNFQRHIISLHPDKTEINYHELKLQVMLNVLQETNNNGERLYYNENINRIFYPSDKYKEERKTLHEQYKEMKHDLI